MACRKVFEKASHGQFSSTAFVQWYLPKREAGSDSANGTKLALTCLDAFADSAIAEGVL